MGFRSIREGRTIRPPQIRSQELRGPTLEPVVRSTHRQENGSVLVEIEGVRRFPVDSVIVAQVFAGWPDRDCARTNEPCQSRAKSTRLLGRQLPGLACVHGIRGRALGLTGRPVISSDHDDMVVVVGHDRKDSGRSVAVSNGGFRDGPSEPSVIRVKDASGRAAGREENVFVTGKREAAITCRERAFARQRRGHVVNWKRGPMLAVGGF